MIRNRMIILATTASIALTGAIVPSAIAGSHWSTTKCSKMYDTWYKHHIGTSSKGPTKKQTREANSYVRALEKDHHCVIGG